MKDLLIALLLVGVFGSYDTHTIFERRDLQGNECQRQEHGALIPYPGNCNKYLVCEYFHGTVMNCPAGLHFNPVLKVCDWPTSAHCTEEGGPPTMPPTEPPTSPPTYPPTDPPTSPPTEPPTSPPTAPPTEPPTSPPTEPPTSPPTEPPTSPPTEPPTAPPTAPPTEPPTGPPTDPPTSPPTEPPTSPPTEPPTSLPTDPPTSPPTETPTCPPTEPPTSPPTEPPTSPPTEPPTPPPTCPPTEPPTPPPTGPPTCPPSESPTPPPTCPPTESPTPPPTDPPTCPPSEPPTPPPTCPPTEPPTSPPTDPPTCPPSEPPTPPPTCPPTEPPTCPPTDPPTCPPSEPPTAPPTCPPTDPPTTPPTCPPTDPPTCPPTDPPTCQPSEPPTPPPTCPPTDPPTPPPTDPPTCPPSEPPTPPPACPPTDPPACPPTEPPTPPPTKPPTCPPTDPPTSPPTESTTEPTIEPTIPTVPPEDNICNGEENGTLFPYKWNCSWYMRCEENKPVVRPCEDGWEFNPNLLICDYPENAGCVATPYPTPTTEEPETTTELTTTTTPEPCTSTPTPETTTSESTIPTMPPEDNICDGEKDGTLFPYLWNCSWYLRCEKNKPVIKPCDDGWEFNPTLLICDYPENAGCEAVPYPTSTTEIPPNTSTEEPPETSSTSTSTTGLPGSDLCCGHPHGDRIPFPGDCTKFMVCEYNDGTVMDCPDGLHFNPIKKVCDWPTSAGCNEEGGSGTSPSVPTDEPTTINPTPTMDPTYDYCWGQPNNTLLTYPWDCGWYVKCEDGNAVIKPCEDGLLFNPSLGICDFPENTGCIATPYPPTSAPTTPQGESSSTEPSTERTTNPPYVGTGICAGHERGTKLSYPGNCQLYIVCKEPAPTAYSCPEGLEFNAETKTCQTPDMAGCSIPKPTEPTTTTEPPSTDLGICANHPLNDLIPYPGNCSEFIWCKLPIPIAQKCPCGKEFNAIRKKCELPEDAGCSCPPSTEYPETTTPEETPTSTPEPPSGNVCCGVENGQRVPYPNNCTLYIECEYPIPILLSCCDDYHFNPNSQQCEPKHKAGCESCEGKENGTLLPYYDDCKKYYYCIDGHEVLLPCTVGAGFDPNVGKCVPGVCQ